MDRGERIDVSGVVAQVALGSEEVNTSVSFLLYGVAELEALNGTKGSHAPTRSCRLWQPAWSQQPLQIRRTSTLVTPQAQSGRRTACSTRREHSPTCTWGANVRQWLASTFYWDPCEEAIVASDPMESASGSAGVAASTPDCRVPVRARALRSGELPRTTCGPWRMRTWRSRSCRGRLPHRTMPVV